MFAAARADGVHPDVRSFATLINGYAQHDRLDDALAVRTILHAVVVALRFHAFLLTSHIGPFGSGFPGC